MFKLSVAFAGFFLWMYTSLYSQQNEKSLMTASTSEILTPKAAPWPRINGPKIFGVRPGSAFLYSIPASGQKPLVYSAKKLPKGLTLDKATGQISGTLDKRGEYNVTLCVTNKLGKVERTFRIIVGDEVILTPPMGWNSWNCWGGAVSQEKVLSSARAFISKGLREHGWTYVNIDDGWQGLRGGKYNAIQPNSKFPDMKALADEIHQLGLKFGIYSTPWIGSYEGHIGSYCNNADGTYDWILKGNHNQYFRIDTVDSTRNKTRRTNRKHGKFSFVENDVKQWNDWGVDYLKYDWSPIDVPHVEEVGKAFTSQKRDIVLSLSNSAPLEGAANWARLSNCWRTTGDIVDNWGSVSKIGFNQDAWTPYCSPGHFNDPDMLVVGRVGWGPNLHPTRLSAAEQYSHISLWCLLSAPLLIGCDLDKLDDFTLNLLTNDEVLEIDQDPLCKQATHVINKNGTDVFVKQLEDHSIAVGLFNRTNTKTLISVTWTDLGITGAQSVRDVWRQKDIAVLQDKYEAEVAPHGVVLVKLTAAK